MVKLVNIHTLEQTFLRNAEKGHDKYCSKIIKNCFENYLLGWRFSSRNWNNFRKLADLISENYSTNEKKESLGNKKIITNSQVSCLMSGYLWVVEISLTKEMNINSTFNFIGEVDNRTLKSFRKELDKALNKYLDVNHVVKIKKYDFNDLENVWEDDEYLKMKISDFKRLLSKSFGEGFELNDKTLWRWMNDRYKNYENSPQSFKGISKHEYSLLDFLHVRLAVIKYNYSSKNFRENVSFNKGFETWFKQKCFDNNLIKDYDNFEKEMKHLFC